MRGSSAQKIKLASYDDLFGGDGQASGEAITSVPIRELHPFKGHPFRVLDDEKMQETVESVKKYGILVPGIVRPCPGGGYEVVSGHRRWRACELAGLDEMPVIIRKLDDDESTVIMVDSNIQREDLLPSEKAKAYRMKYDALKHQGSRAGGRTIEEMGETAGESSKTVQRYIWLSRLSDRLLDMVDRKKIGFMQGLDISFLSAEEQGWVQDILERQGVCISTFQSARLKEYGRRGELTPALAETVLAERKERVRKITIRKDAVRKYFSDDYSNEEIERIILELLDGWKERQEADGISD